MKKEEKSTPTSGKHRSVYKYQLKATNQILKDTLDLCKSSLHLTAHTNRHKQNPFQDLDLYLFDQSYIDKFIYNQPKININDLPKRNNCSFDIFGTNFTKKSFQEIQPSKKSLQKQFLQNYRHQKSRREDFFERQQINNSQICSFSSQNSNFPPKTQKISIALGPENYSKKDNHNENKKEVKRQRRGLANISLKVKNIVAKLGKMTFKEVSDQVLKESEEYLPEETEAREKQMRNIRRRVYDALNVLVSVGILGKSDRCVTHTSITTVPGKKLSEHWQVLTQKNKIIQEMQSSYTNKLIDLKKLKISYQKMLLFHERNRQLNELSEKKEESTRPHQREHFSINTQQIRFYFPIIIVFPPKNGPLNMKVQIQQEQKPSQKIKKFIIEGSDEIQTELALLNYLNLKVQLNKENPANQKKQCKMENVKKGHQQKKSILKREATTLKLEEDIYLSD